LLVEVAVVQTTQPMTLGVLVVVLVVIALQFQENLLVEVALLSLL
jgi:hypothetical protein